MAKHVMTENQITTVFCGLRTAANNYEMIATNYAKAEFGDRLVQQFTRQRDDALKLAETIEEYAYIILADEA